MKLSIVTMLATALLLQAGPANAQKIAGYPDPSWAPYPSSANAAVPQTDVVAAQPDGKVLAAGYSSGGYAVLRFGSSGALDPTFGTGGKATLRVGLSGVVQDMSVDSEGRIYVTGTYYEILFNDGGTVVTGLAVARFRADGAPDESYGSGGVAKLPLEVERRGGSTRPDTAAQQMFSQPLPSTVEGIAVQPDGKLVLLTHGEERGSTQVSVIVVRLDANGALDAGFADNGVALLRLPGRGASAALAIAEDGAIFVAGREFRDYVQPYAAFVMKLTPQGLLDSAFGSEGRATLAPPSLAVSYAAYEIALQDDRILVAGDYAGYGSGGEQTLVYRLLADGTLDQDFGTNGIALHDFAPNEERTSELALDADGRIYLAGTGGLGSVDNEPFIGRLQADGSRDTSFVATPARPRRQRGMDLVVTDAAYLLIRSNVPTGPTFTAVYKLAIGSGADPVLPRTPAVLAGDSRPTTAQFSIVMRDANGTPIESASTAQRVDVIGYLFPDAADIGREVQIHVAAETPLGWYYRDVNGDFRRWSTNRFDLEPASDRRVLNAAMPVTVLSGRFPTAGVYRLYVGYEFPGGMLVYGAPPRTIEVTAP